MDVVKKPLTATIIEEMKLPPPPPPPPKKIIEAPKVAPPPETYVPPPDIPVPAINTAPTITATTAAPPVEPHVIAGPRGRAASAAAEAGGAARRHAHFRRQSGVSESGHQGRHSKGRVVARLNIDEKGNVTEVTIFSADPPRVFRPRGHHAR